MKLIRRAAPATPTPGDRRGTRPGRLVRGGVLLSLAGLLGVGMALGDRFQAEPNEMNDGSAWLAHGDDLVRGSSITGEADVLVAGVVKGTAQIAQDGSDAIVVVGGKAFAMDSSTLKPSASLDVARQTTALTRGGKGYLISAGLITCVDPQTLSQVGGTIATPASASAPAPGVVDEKGQLWVAMKRTGEVWRIRDCVVDKRAAVFGKGHDVGLTLAGGRPVLHDEDADTVTWIDTRSAKAKASGDVPHDALLQGPSMEGDRVWLAGPGRILTGVALDGSVTTIDLSLAGLHRPEVIGDRVLVPSKEDGGAVVVVDAPPGERPTELLTKPFPAATEDDFGSFVKDGAVWFTAPAERLHGTVASNGEIDELEVAEEELEAAAEATPQDPVDVAPVPPTPAANRPADTPTDQPTPPVDPGPGDTPDTSTPSTVPLGGAGTSTSTSTSTTPSSGTSTSTTKVQVTVPDVRTLEPVAACQQVQAEGLLCRSEPYPTSSSDPLNQVVEQAPAGGQKVDEGATVVVRYYASTNVPDVSGRTEADACNVLAQLQLVCSTSYGDPGATVTAPATVFGQGVAVGTTVGAHSTVPIQVDNTAYRPFLSCRAPLTADGRNDPEGYRTTVTTAACPAGWQTFTLGRLAATQGSNGRVPVTLWRVKPGVLADPSSGQRSDRLTLAGDPSPGSDFTSAGVIGYAWRTDPDADGTGPESVLWVFGTGTGADDGSPAAGNTGNILYVREGTTNEEVNQDGRPYSGANIAGLCFTWIT